MKLMAIFCTNFASYDNLDFNFEGQGLALIHGATGSGKSTLQDAACWVLYGQTAKGLGSDEIRSWGTSEATQALLMVGTQTGMIAITRKRGKQSENDLYWQESGYDQKHRGKDITETQKLLNQRLGCGPELYLAGAYSHEFSATGAFFTAKAKDRRELFEILADLSLPTRLGVSARDEKRNVKKLLATAESSFQQAEGRVLQLCESIADSSKRSTKWEGERDSNIRQLADKERSFEETVQKKIAECAEQKNKFMAQVKDEAPLRTRLDAIRAKIKELSPEKCKECGAPKQADLLIHLQKENADVASEIAKNDTVLGSLERIQDTLDTLTTGKVYIYSEELEREKSKVNPFVAQIEKLKFDLEVAEADRYYWDVEYSTITHKICCLSQLYDISSQLRAQLLQITISNVEHQTNDYLTRFFDGEFRVGFTMTDSDDLDITIDKNGQECVFRQLSKGQRQILRASFTIAVMKAASDRAGVHFNCLFFDEILDGLDAELKVKAYALFEELSTSHESVFVIDHSTELKSLFTKSYQVELVGDHSEIKEHE